MTSQPNNSDTQYSHIDSVDENEQLTEKAGGIIVRDGTQGKEIYLIHRNRYDDWSVPKGHIDEGEAPIQAALREVTEETGMHCSVERPLPPFFYTTPEGEQVVVHYFEMKMLGDGLKLHDDEVDHGEWKSIPDAVKLFTYQNLQKYITDLFGR